VRHLFAAGALLGISGCNSAAEDAVRKELNDPQSAQFTEVVTAKGVTCGLVNSRNALGGYPGLIGFVVENDVALLDNGAGEEFDRAFFSKCPLDIQSDYNGMRIHRQADELNRRSGK
jgi:hypothetical protein